MKTKFIVENFTHESSYQGLVKAIKKEGGEVQEIKKGFQYRDLDKYDEKSPLLFFGSIEMTNIVTRHLYECYPVSYSNHTNYLCSNYMTYFGEYLFNDKYAMVSLNELHRQKRFFYDTFGKDSYIFLRPDSGQKTFQAKLLEECDFERFYISNDMVRHNLVIVSTPKNIKWEGRFIVSKYGEIIAHSTYRKEGKILRSSAVPKESIELCKKLLDTGYYPDSVFCIDICEDDDGNYWLLELNTFSSAGLYNCDKRKIVQEVSKIAEEDWKTWKAII